MYPLRAGLGRPRDMPLHAPLRRPQDILAQFSQAEHDALDTLSVKLAVLFYQQPQDVKRRLLEALL